MEHGPAREEGGKPRAPELRERVSVGSERWRWLSSPVSPSTQVTQLKFSPPGELCRVSAKVAAPTPLGGAECEEGVVAQPVHGLELPVSGQRLLRVAAGGVHSLEAAAERVEREETSQLRRRTQVT